MAIAQSPRRRPRIAVTLGDAVGVGPELIAKLLHNSQNTDKADIIVLADQSELNEAVALAGGISIASSFEVLDDSTAPSTPYPAGQPSKQAGERCMHQLKRGLELSRRGEIDGIVFAPLNKTSLKKAGMTQEDELRWFADQLDYRGTTSEINIAGPLWTARVTSHIGIESVAAKVTKASTLKAIELLHQLRWESGIETPRLAVCALNPHNGENGSFGRQEPDAIAPAVLEAQSRGIFVQGPFPCDTIFLKRAHFDGIITMYHDQGQIAMKLLSFEGGVTVQGGLPVVIATPAHGTAFDIVGKNLASPVSMQSAFDIAVTMASRRLDSQASAEETHQAPVPVQTSQADIEKLLATAEVKEVVCC